MLEQVRLEKAATDAGFDLPGAEEGGWLQCRSSQFSLTIWLRPEGVGGEFAVSISDVAIAEEALSALPSGSVGALVGEPPAEMTLRVKGYGSLYELLRRAGKFAQSIRGHPLREFQARTTHLPRNTEAERLVVARIGQEQFRQALIAYWDGRCAVTGYTLVDLLRASHAKPWARCKSDAERLDPFNGLLLTPNLDAAFDSGWITFDDHGYMLVSPHMTAEEVTGIGIELPMKLRWVSERHLQYLHFHRAGIFKR